MPRKRKIKAFVQGDGVRKIIDETIKEYDKKIDDAQYEIKQSNFWIKTWTEHRDDLIKSRALL